MVVSGRWTMTFVGRKDRKLNRTRTAGLRREPNLLIFHWTKKKKAYTRVMNTPFQRGRFLTGLMKFMFATLSETVVTRKQAKLLTEDSQSIQNIMLPFLIREICVGTNSGLITGKIFYGYLRVDNYGSVSTRWDKRRCDVNVTFWKLSLLPNGTIHTYAPEWRQTPSERQTNGKLACEKFYFLFI